MAVKLLHKLGKALARPHLIKPFFKERVLPLAYYLGDGSWSFKPERIQIYVNNVCNARCKMCDIGVKNKESVFYRQVAQTGDNALTVEVYRRLIREISHFKPRIFICGLEPLLHEKILDLIAVNKEHGLYTKLVTNGMLLPRVAGQLVNLGVDHIVVSLDGPEDIHDHIRGKGFYRQALTGIRLLKEARARCDKKAPIISTHSCIIDVNHHSLVDFATTMLGQEKVDFISFAHPYYVTPGASAAHNRHFSYLGESTPVNLSAINLDVVDADVLFSQMQQLKQLFPEDKVFFNVDLHSPEKVRDHYHRSQTIVAKTKCLIPWQCATILANGDVIIHNRCFSYKTGNINESSFNDIWRGEGYKNFRRELRKAGLFPVCKRCCGSF